MFLHAPTPITPDSHNLPPSLTAGLRATGHSSFTALGNLAILDELLLALFCSVKCPGRLILQTYDLVATLRDRAVPTIGGFHTPMECECLSVLFRSSQPIVVCPARSIDNFRVPSEWKAPLADGWLLVLSPFAPSDRRPTKRLAAIRNALVAALAARVFVAYADPGWSYRQTLRGRASCWKAAPGVRCP